jgi:medium-chain acyl-[acyl-carrier-protein] hydrolase
MVNPHSTFATAPAAARWFTPFPKSPGEGRALVCLPHAGGGASEFSGWQSHARLLDVLAVRLPGREARIAEAAFETIDDLVEAFLPALVPVARRGCVLFGHSMGALVAYEVARRLMAEALPAPLALVVSGCVAPHVLEPEQVHEFSDERLVQWLIDINGVEPEVLNYPKLLELMLPTVRADMRLVDDYRYREGVRLDIPVRALQGKEDLGTPVELAGKWGELTTGTFDLDIFPGDHFFFRDHVPRVMSIIESCTR